MDLDIYLQTIPIVISSSSCLSKCGMYVLYHSNGVPSIISTLEMYTVEPLILSNCTTKIHMEIWSFWGSSSKNSMFLIIKKWFDLEYLTLRQM